MRRAVAEIPSQGRAFPLTPRSYRPTPRLVPLGGGSGLPILLQSLKATFFPRGWMGAPRNGGGGLRWASKGPVRVLLAGDDQGVRAAVKRLLEGGRGARVVGEAGDGEEAVRLARALRPDVVLMEIAVPRLDGLEATRQIKVERPEAKVIILTGDPEEAWPKAAGPSGADAFLPKRALIALLLSMKAEEAEA